MSKPLAWFAAAAGLAAASALFSVSGRAHSGRKLADALPAPDPALNGVVLSTAVQTRNGIRVARLRAVVRTERLEATAVALSAQGLLEARQSYVAATARLAQARAALDVSRQEYERLKSLLANENVSMKDVQAAEGTFLSDKAGLQAAEDAASLTEAMVRQTWGPAVTTWILDRTPAFDRLARQEDLLLQVTPPAGSLPVTAPAVHFRLPDGRTVLATFVSSYPRVSRQIQGVSYLYLTRSRPDLLPGMSLAALLPVKTLRGVIIPASAVVWEDGAAWAYVETAADRFSRREVPTQNAVPGGWLTARSFRPGETVVVSGAQQLLSVELHSGNQAGD
jgi:multidrug efflux system membrane fusion protein